MKNSFSMLELILVILLMSFLYMQFLPKNKIDYLVTPEKPNEVLI